MVAPAWRHNFQPLAWYSMFSYIKCHAGFSFFLANYDQNPFRSTMLMFIFTKLLSTSIELIWIIVRWIKTNLSRARKTLTRSN